MERRQPVLSPEHDSLPHLDGQLLAKITIAMSMREEIAYNLQAGETDPTVNSPELAEEYTRVGEDIERLVAEADKRGREDEVNSIMEVVSWQEY